MKQLLIIAALLAPAVNAQTIDNWTASGAPVRNSTNLCWRDANWTPATAHPECDGAIKAQPAAPAPAPVAKPAPAPAVEPARPLVVKTSYAADTFFDFDRSVIKAEGKIKLNDLVAKLKSINVEVVIVVGHTDSVGTDAYNMKLGQRRAQAVQAYLVSQGVEPRRIYTESRGEGQPVADNKTAQGRAKNRRVEVEVVGTRK